jgi:hypothetical protein
MSPAIKSSLLAGIGGAVPGAVLSGVINYAFVGMPADATINAINHAISGLISGFLGGFFGLFFYLRQHRPPS